jgi:hypothetical protein
MLILERAQLGMQLEHIDLNHVNRWVQVHDLPMGFMRETVGIKLANYIGAFVEYDKNNNSSFWRQHMRIRVRIDVRNPLKKDYKVKDKGGAWCTVKFKYEKLGIFCFVCGVMGHAENKCEILYAKDQDDGVRGWSTEIRADPRRQGGRITSKWLTEEKRGKTEHGGSMMAGQSSFPVENPNTGPTDAELASSIPTSFHNQSANHHTAIITRQQQSLALNHLSVQPLTQTVTVPTSVSIQNARIPILAPAITTADTIINSLPTVIPFLSSNQISPLPFNTSATDNNKSSLLPNYTLTFNSQPNASDPHPAQKLLPYPNPKPDPFLNRTRPDKKPKSSKLKSNPTQTHVVPSTDLETTADVEIHSEKKRRREDGKTTSNVTVLDSEHFLTAGPGSQACRDK